MNSGQNVIYQTIADNLAGFVWVFEYETREVKFSKSLAHVTGYAPSFTAGKKWRSVIHPDDLMEVDKWWQLALTNVQPKIDMCFRIKHANGSYIWIGSTAMVVFDNERNVPLRIFGVGSDITAKKQREIADQARQDELINSLQSYERFFNSALDFMFITDEQGIILSVNDAVRNKLHYGDELIGQHWLTLHPPELHLQATENLQRILSGELRYCPLEIVAKDGQRFSVESTVSIGILNGKQVMFGISRDVTDIHSMEYMLEKSRVDFRKAFDFSAASTAIYSLPRNQYVSINKNFERITGYRAEEIIGKSNAEINAIPSLEMRAKIREHLAKHGSILNWEVEFRVKNGEIRTGLFCATLVELDEPVIITTAVDIQELKDNQKTLEEEVSKRTEELNETIQMLSAILEALPDLMFLMDDEGIFHDYHTYNRDLLYADQETIVGNRVDDLLPPDVCMVIRNVIVETIANGCSKGAKYSLLMEGKLNWFELSAARISPTSNLLVILARDITHHIQIEEDIKQSEAKYKALFYGNESIMLIVDPDTGKITDANKAASDFYGYSLEEFTTLSMWEINTLPPVEIKARLALAVQRESNHFIFEHRLKSGEQRDVEVYSGPIIIDGQYRLYSIIHDITVKLKTERALAKQQQLLASVIEGSGAGIWDWNIQTGEVWLNERWAEMVGYTLAELQPLRIELWDMLCHPDDQQASQQIQEQHLAGIIASYDCQLRMRHKDGSWVWIQSKGKVVEWDKTGKPLRMSGTHIDITHDKVAEAELLYRIQLEKIVTEAATELVQASPDNLKQTIIRTLELMAKFTGVDRVHIFMFNAVPNPAEDILCWCDTGIESIIDDAQKVDFNQYAVVMDKLNALEPFALPVEGDESPEMQKAVAEFNKFGILSAIGIPIHIEERLMGFLSIEAVKAPKVWLEEDILLLKNYCNVLANAINNNANLKQIVLAKAQAEESNNIKNIFLANINHELRTPLNGLSSFLELLDPLSFSAEYREYLTYIKSSTRQLVSIVDDMLSFNQLQSGAGVVKAAEFNLHELVDQVISTTILESIRKGISYTAKMDSRTDWALVGDSTILKQILLALTNNAIKFTEAGSVTVKCELIEHPDLRLSIVVADTGIGIESDKQANIFNEFYQIESEFTRHYGGTGMGLAVVKKHLELLKGSLNLQSTVGKGSEFTIEIPISLPVKVIPETSFRTTSANGRILVVEDNPMNLRIMTLLLQRNGYDIVTAINGKIAFDLTLTERFDVILMDIQMPVMDGITATELIREYEKRLNRHTPIIAVTAHVSEYDRSICLKAGMDDVEHKPINYEQLAGKMQAYMSKNRSGT